MTKQTEYLDHERRKRLALTGAQDEFERTQRAHAASDAHYVLLDVLRQEMAKHVLLVRGPVRDYEGML
jgi:hypothetical protein